MVTMTAAKSQPPLLQDRSSSLSASHTGQVTATLLCANCSDLLLINAALLSEKTIDVLGVYVMVISSMKNAFLNRLGHLPSRRWLTWFKGKSQSHRFRFFVWGYNRLRKPNSVGNNKGK
jgi:hypothetical protein